MIAPRGTEPEGLRANGTRFLTLGGGRVRYLDEGSGTTVLLIHGIGRSLEDWIEQYGLLAGRGYRVLSVDLAGFGESDPLQEAYSLPALARFVESFLDALGISEPVHVVGNSLGGAVAMQLAAHTRDRVLSLILADSAGFGREVAASVRLISVRPLGRLLLGKQTPEASRRLELSLFHDPSFVTNDRVQLGYRLSMRTKGTDVFLDTAAALGTFRGARKQWRNILMTAMAEQQIPTLVFWGKNDRIFPVSHLAAAHQLLPHARTHSFPNTGHMPHIERAKEFATETLDFWTTAERRP